MARNMLTGIAYDVTETYADSGRMGRVSSRVTALTKGGAANESWTLGVDYDEYGLPSSIDYPTCAGTGCRTGSGAAYNVTFGRTDGMLTSIPNWTGGTITYHPNLMVASVPHANGSTETIANDPDGLARPLSIQATAKVSGVFTAEWKTGTYAFDGAGNVMSMTDATKIDKFKYDKVSRLTGSTLGSLATSRSQNYAFDTYGNITSITTDGVAVNTPTSAATNRLNATGTTYDPRGSLTAWNGQSYAWDQFRVMKERCTSGTIGACTGTGAELWRYAYTADGERVLALKSDGTKEIWTLRGLDNKVLRRDDTGVLTSYVYRDDRSFGSIDSTGKIQHFATDHLGTIRLITNSTGTKLAEHTYFPFGEEATALTQDVEAMKFTAHERDLMSTPSDDSDDLDYMHARLFGPNIGRFLSPDIAGVSLTTPQSWNRYSYVGGNPAVSVDPDGEVAVAVLAVGAVAVAGVIVAEAYLQSPSEEDPSRTNAQSIADRMQEGFEVLQEGFQGLFGTISLMGKAKGGGRDSGLLDLTPEQVLERYKKAKGADRKRYERELKNLKRKNPNKARGGGRETKKPKQDKNRKKPEQPNSSERVSDLNGQIAICDNWNSRCVN